MFFFLLLYLKLAKIFVKLKILNGYNSKFFITLHTLNFELRYGSIILVKKIINKFKKEKSEREAIHLAEQELANNPKYLDY